MIDFFRFIVSYFSDLKYNEEKTPHQIPTCKIMLLMLSLNAEALSEWCIKSTNLSTKKKFSTIEYHFNRNINQATFELNATLLYLKRVILTYHIILLFDSDAVLSIF